jgi:CRP/FNR family transcriptional regulator, anaerobic regulatory protein
MLETNYDTTPRARPPCSACAQRQKGLCQGVDEHDLDGSAALEDARLPVRFYGVEGVIYRQGDPSDHVFNLISGWCALHRDLADGRRQIIRFLQPGAVFGIEAAGQDLGHGATAITNATACPIGRTLLDGLRHQIPPLNERFISILETDNRHGIEALTMLGLGTAKNRIGALLSDLVCTAAGQMSVRAGEAFKIPLTQQHIGQATGLTSIHVNRVLRQLREDRIVELQFGVLAVIDPDKLFALAQAHEPRQRPAAKPPRPAARTRLSKRMARLQSRSQPQLV